MNDFTKNTVLRFRLRYVSVSDLIPLYNHSVYLHPAVTAHEEIAILCLRIYHKLSSGYFYFYALLMHENDFVTFHRGMRVGVWR